MADAHSQVYTGALSSIHQRIRIDMHTSDKYRLAHAGA